MAKSLDKVILFSRITHGKNVMQWPTAVFNAEPAARTFATLLAVAHKSGDVATALAMDPHTKTGEDGKLLAGLKFSIVKVPYEPQAAVAADDMFSDDPAPTT